MGNFHVPVGVHLDRKIFRFLSFHEFIDTLKFSQVLFSPLNAGGDSKAKHVIDSSVRNPALDHFSDHGLRPGTCLTIARQTWTRSSKEAIHDWNDTPEAQPRICIVSSVRALTESLFTDDATSIRIDAPEPDAADGMVQLMTYSTRAAHAPPPDQAGIRVLADLGRMLTGIVVSAEASERFLNLVARVVQENTVINVSRAVPSVRMARLAG